MHKTSIVLALAAAAAVALLMAMAAVVRSRPHLQACLDCDSACLPSHPAPVGSGTVQWLGDPIDPNNLGPNMGDCDQNTEGEAPCEQEEPCEATGMLRFRNISAADIRYQIVVNGNVGAGWQILGPNQIARIDWTSGYELPCGYLDTTGDGDPIPTDSRFEILIQHDSGGQWNVDSARYWWTCSLCPRDENEY